MKRIDDIDRCPGCGPPETGGCVSCRPTDPAPSPTREPRYVIGVDVGGPDYTAVHTVDVPRFDTLDDRAAALRAYFRTARVAPDAARSADFFKPVETEGA